MSEEEVEVAESQSPARSRFEAMKKVGRWLLLAVGITAVVWLVHDAGPANVWRALLAAGPYLPLVLLFEIGFVGVDVMSIRSIHGERAKSVPLWVWIRSAMMAYGVMVLLPAGRAGAEVMRAAQLTPYLGGPRSAAAATMLQGITLFGNTLISIPSYIAVGVLAGFGSSLAWLVLGNGIATGVIGAVILYGARMSNIGGWLGRRIKALGASGAHFDESLKELPKAPVRPIVWSFLGRLSQTAQYAVILLAVGGALTLPNAFLAQAVHLVGAGLGDMVPNQAGITEGAYRIFAPQLGLAAAQAISMALIHRLAQFLLAGVSLLTGVFWKVPEQDAAKPDVTESADERTVGSPAL